MDWFLECCCTSAEEVAAAQKLGAKRIELCSQLEVGGVTPSESLLREVHSIARIPVNVLIRPHRAPIGSSEFGFTAADFVYSPEEVDQILSDIRMCAPMVSGVVIGALTPTGSVDMPVMRRLIAEAHSLGLSVTFHRAFDVCADPLAAFDVILSLGCERLLTSGHEPKAEAGAPLLAQLVALAGPRLIVMPGSGIRPSNIYSLFEITHAREFHASFAYFSA